MRGDGEQRDTLMVIRYHDEYSRSVTGWLISHRKLQIDWEEDRPLTV